MCCIVRRERDRGRQAARDVQRKARTGQDRRHAQWRRVSAMISVMKAACRRSIPLAQAMTGVAGCDREGLRDCAAPAPAPPAAPPRLRLEPARRDRTRASSRDARQSRAFARRRNCCGGFRSSRATSVTARPARAATLASAVPHAPAPTTAMRSRSCLAPPRSRVGRLGHRSSGQRARGRGIERVGEAAARSRSTPAQAIMAPLSVQSSGGGSTSTVPRLVRRRRCSARRIAWLAATPPAATSAVGVAELRRETAAGPPAAGPRRRRPPPPGTTRRDPPRPGRRQRRDPLGLEPHARSSGRRTRSRRRRARASAAAARSARSSPARPRARPAARPDSRGRAAWRSCRRPRRSRRRAWCRAARSRRPRARRRAACGRRRPAAGRYGKATPSVSRAVSACASRWLTAISGFSPHQRDRLRGGEPDDHAADQAGPGRGRDRVEVVEAHARLDQRPGDDRVERLDMGARGDLRHDAAIGGVLGRSGAHHVRQDVAAPVGRRSTTAAAVSSQVVSMPSTTMVLVPRFRSS